MSKHDKRMEMFNRLVQLEPRLQLLLQEAESVVDDGGKSFCANQVWYSRFKPRLRQLVGNEGDVPPGPLRSPEAYDVAVQVIYHKLPDCRTCSCWP
jgi:hypothetical protein